MYKSEIMRPAIDRQGSLSLFMCNIFDSSMLYAFV
jgi:hypothetical protein